MVTEHTYIFNNNAGLLFWILVATFAFIIHFLPSFIAFSRDHPSPYAILILNIFFGWTGIGWLILLFWALS